MSAYKKLLVKALEKIAAPGVLAQSNGHFTAFIGGKLFEAREVRGFSGFGLYMVLGITEDKGSKRYLSFAADEESKNGIFPVGPEDKEGMVTVGYTVERMEKPTIEYPAILGGAEITFKGDGPYSGEFIVELMSDKYINTIAGAKFHLNKFEEIQ
ncbi:hypothetical protein [Pseudomonas entomophila]|uniref:Uncharacterized protein n=1 Tax=Pseudomonas entomophila TaxID=312306 RepID=A0ABY9QRB7_9PSED|nr:hypothetical protein [Pseudomonas entomophila]WMW06216.1 hypothetical protein RAH46_02480 [Pseudomonas entomophila]